MTNRLILVVGALIFNALSLFSQTQQGYVKTIGRPNAPGSPLGGVTIRLNGNVNSLLSNNKGTFSFPINENKSFKFSRIAKNGFELADPDFLRYSFGYSSNSPITIAMVSKEELRRESDAIEMRMRQELTRRFEKQNALYERELERNKLSEDEFSKKLLELREKFDNIDTLVSELSERYARTDYDCIDSLHLEINKYIESGELERAQQLIFSKGNLDDRAKELEETRKLRILTQQKEESLLKDLATDLLKLHEIAINQNKMDSAYYYMEKRYLLDSTNVEYLFVLANTIFPRYNFPIDERKKREKQHEYYLLDCYKRIQNPDNCKKLISLLGTNQTTESLLGIIENEIGRFYYHVHEYEKSIEYYKKRLRNDKSKSDIDVFPLIDIGEAYLAMKDSTQALYYYREAKSCLSNKQGYTKYYLSTRIARFYYNVGKMNNAYKEYIEAEKALRLTLANDSNVWNLENLYILQAFIGNMYKEKRKYSVAAIYYLRAVNNAELYYKLTSESKSLGPIVTLCRDLQDIYYLQKKYLSMEDCAKKAIEYAELYMKRFPSSLSRLQYAEALCLMAGANANVGKTESVEHDLIECLKNCEFASVYNKKRYNLLAYRIYTTFAINYAKQGKYTQALYSINKAITIMPLDFLAYEQKMEILNSVGKKKEAKKVYEDYQRIVITKNNTAGTNNNYLHFLNPLFDFQYNHFRNN